MCIELSIVLIVSLICLLSDNITVFHHQGWGVNKPLFIILCREELT